MNFLYIPFSQRFDLAECHLITEKALFIHNRLNRVRIFLPESSEFAFFDLKPSGHPVWPYACTHIRYSGSERDIDQIREIALKQLGEKLNYFFESERFKSMMSLPSEDNYPSPAHRHLIERLSRPFAKPFPIAERFLETVANRGYDIRETEFLLAWKNGDFSGKKDKAEQQITDFLADEQADLKHMPGVIPALYGFLDRLNSWGPAAAAVEKIRQLYPESDPDRSRVEAVLAAWKGIGDDYFRFLFQIPRELQDWDPVPLCFLSRFWNDTSNENNYLPISLEDFLWAGNYQE